MLAVGHQATRLVVPVLDSSDVVTIPVAELPTEPEEVLELLACEAAPLSTWFDFAKAYLSLGREDAFKHICEEGIKDEVTEEVMRFFGSRPVYEQTVFHCALATLHMSKGRDEPDRAKKAEAFALAAKHIQSAKQMNPDEQMVTVTQGMLHIAKNEIQQAKQEFTRACSQLNNGRTNIVALLTLAGLLFNQKQYKDALLLYRRALATNPACPAEVRLGIAACQFYLGEMSAAAAAFERVLALDPHNADAMLGLAVIKFRSPNVQQGLADGLRLLVRAYELDPGNVGTLVLLSHYALLRGDYHKALVLAKAAQEANPTELVQAITHCLLGRAHHALKQWTEASSHYAASVRTSPNQGLPHLGLAQLYVMQENAMNASTELEHALKESPGLPEALKILTQVVGDDPSKVAKALVHMKTAAAKADDDPDVRELLGEMCAAAGDHAGALAAYKKALSIHRERRKVSEEAHAQWQAAQQEKRQRAAEEGHDGGLFGDDDAEENDDAGPSLHVIPAMLLNNTAVLCYRAGDLQEAMTLLEEARQVAATSQAGQLPPQHMVALRYNIARVQEASGLLKEAEEGYKAILSETPSYIDCVLRLACVARTKGASHEAMEWARKATTMEHGHTDALALMSQLAMERRDYAQADQCIKQLLTKNKEQIAAAVQEKSGGPAPPLDAYAHLAYGNLLLVSAPSDRRKEADARKAENQMYKALECYRTVLKADPTNAFAANGVGAVLAELGLLNEAQEVFGEVQAAVAASSGFLNIPDVFINMASVALAKEEYVTAQKLYKKALDKLGDTKKSVVLLYLARAHYDCDDLPAAKAYLLRALHIAPTDHKLRFNAALTMQEYAIRTYRKKRPAPDPNKLADYQRAQADLQCAARYFEHLNTLGPARTKLDPAKLKTHIKFCNDQLVKTQHYVEQAEKEHKKLQDQRQAQENMRAVEQEKKALAARIKAESEKALQEAKEAEARRAHEKAERLKQEWRLQRSEQEAQEEAENGGAKKKKGKKGEKGGGKAAARSMAGDDEEPSAGEEDAADAEEERRLEEENKTKGGDDDDDDDLFGSGDEGDQNMEDVEDGGEGAAPRKGRLGKRVRAAAEEEEGAGAGEEEEADDAFLHDLEEPEAAAGGTNGLEDEPQDEPAVKKRRAGKLLDDSDGEAE